MSNPSFEPPSFMEEAPSPCAYLEVLGSAGERRETIRLNDRNYYILGRSAESCNITVAHHSTISRQHCVLCHGSMENNSTFAILDLGSANGTKVNGLPIRSHTWIALYDDDRIQLGDANTLYTLLGTNSALSGLNILKVLAEAGCGSDVLVGESEDTSRETSAEDMLLPPSAEHK